MFGEIPRKEKKSKSIRNSDENCRKKRILTEFRTGLTNFCEYFEFGSVRRCANLVDLEKCWKMIIYLQRSALIQPRTSLGKSDVSAVCDRAASCCGRPRRPEKRSFSWTSCRTESGACTSVVSFFLPRVFFCAQRHFIWCSIVLVLMDC